MRKCKYKTRVLLSAYTQLNLGDDLFIKSIIERYPNTLFVIPCGKEYKDFFSLYNNVIHVNLNRGWISLVDRLMRRVEESSYYVKNSFLLKYLDSKYHFTHYIVIGGSIFMESSSKNKGYNVYKSYLRVKKILKHAYLDILGCNFGPCMSEQYKEHIYKVLLLADDVCFRDRKSYESFPKINTIRLGNDVVLESLTVPRVEKKKKVGISLISLKERNDLLCLIDSYRNKISEIISYFVGKNYEVVLFSFCKHLGDLDEAKDIYSSLKDNQKVSIYSYEGNLTEALRTFGEMEYLIASRFHAVILGMIFNMKMFPIAYSNKTKDMLNDYGLWKENYDIQKFVNLGMHNFLDSFISSFSIETRESQYKVLDCQFTLM